MKGIKHDAGKPMWDLLPWGAMREVVKVLTKPVLDGKYAKHNWKRVKGRRDRYFAAGMRHFADWYEGQRFDKETKYSNLAHTIACCLFLLHDDLKAKGRMKRKGVTPKG